MIKYMVIICGQYRVQCMVKCTVKYTVENMVGCVHGRVWGRRCGQIYGQKYGQMRGEPSTGQTSDQSMIECTPRHPVDCPAKRSGQTIDPMSGHTDKAERMVKYVFKYRVQYMSSNIDPWHPFRRRVPAATQICALYATQGVEDGAGGKGREREQIGALLSLSPSLSLSLSLSLSKGGQRGARPAAAFDHLNI